MTITDIRPFTLSTVHPSFRSSHPFSHRCPSPHWHGPSHALVSRTHALELGSLRPRVSVRPQMPRPLLLILSPPPPQPCYISPPISQSANCTFLCTASSIRAPLPSGTRLPSHRPSPALGSPKQRLPHGGSPVAVLPPPHDASHAGRDSAIKISLPVRR